MLFYHLADLWQAIFSGCCNVTERSEGGLKKIRCWGMRRSVCSSAAKNKSADTQYNERGTCWLWYAGNQRDAIFIINQL